MDHPPIKRKGVLGSYVGIILIIAFKSAKLFKVAKPLVTIGSMSLSAFLYALWLGPWFALALVLLLLVHEMGHVVALRLRGYPASSPVFIPFLGAAIFGPRFATREDEAVVALGGPLLGGALALALAAVWLLMPTGMPADLVLVSSYFGVFLNLFNLLPVSPLDGGRITQAVGDWFIYIGMASLFAVSLWLLSPVMLLIWILVLPDFPMLSRRHQFWIGGLLLISMASLMALGFSTQPLWVDVCDIVIGIVMVLALLNHYDEPMKVALPALPALPAADRMRWLITYVAIVMVLAVVMGWQYPHLPGGQH